MKTNTKHTPKPWEGLAKELDRDNGDNGTYIVEGFEIKKRLFKNDGGEFDEKYYLGVLESVLERNAAYFEEHAGVR